MLLSADLLWTLADPGTNPQAGALFGYSVAADGNLTVLGAPYACRQGYTDVGCAYILNSATGTLVATLVNPTPWSYDFFGYSVAISGNTVVVGAYQDRTGATNSGSAYVFDAATGNLLRTINNPTPAYQDNFAYSVAVSGSTVVVGAPNDDTGATDSGSAYVFDAGTGNLLHTMNNPTPAASDNFGWSVAVSGSIVVVGTPNDDTGATDAGSAYVFDAATGNPLAALANPAPAASDNFGCSVAVSGSTVVVGAYQDDAGATNSGSAYVFDAATANLLRTLNNPTPAPIDNFGWSVAVSGNTVVVGAAHDDTGATDSGSAYVFDATTGTFLRTVNNPTPAASDNFGFGLAVSGSTVIVGAPYDDTGATDSGSGYVFDAATGNLLRTLINPTPATGDNFGTSVAASGNTVVVGAPNDDTGGADSGRAYVYDAATGNLLRTLNNPTPAAGDYFGCSVAISGNTVVVGAYDDSTSTSYAGTAYIFDALTGNLVHTLNNPTPLPGDAFGWSVAVAGSTVVVGAPSDDTGAGDSGSAYVFDAGTGNLLRTLNNPTPASYDHFGQCVAISGSTVVVGAPGDDTGATEAGSAYVLDTGTGNLLRTLNNPTPGTYAYFGGSVAIAGGIVVVGSPQESTGGTYSGSAFVFDWGTGNIIYMMKESTPASFMYFGASVAIMGGTVVVGASGHSSAYVFNPVTGDLLQTIHDPTPEGSGGFGVSMAVAGHTLVVGASTADGGTLDRGAAYVLADNQPFASFTAVPNPAAPTQAINFDASGSYHGSPAHAIVRYEWDFNSDGVYDATGVTANHAYGQFGTYTATLRVTDDNAPPKTATTTVVVNVNQGNQAPVANPGGPYIAHIGANLMLDGSLSSDPNIGWGDRIVSYAWDLDNDGQYDDASGATPTVPWAQLAGLPTSTNLPVGLRITDSLGATGTAATTLRIVLPEVVGRYAFYNNSYWDGNDPAANAADDAAIATDKQALLPGGTATFGNYTSYSRGINGIMIDVAGLPAGVTPTAADFEFRVGNDTNSPSGWPLAGGSPSVSVRRGEGAGGTDRITLTFPDGTAAGKWLRVKVLASGAVGLAGDDVFYFGNAVGEVGNVATPQDAKVTTLDVSLTRANLIAFPAAPTITNVYDFNRDHKVNTLDVSLVRSSLTTAMNALKLITVPAAAMLTDDGLATRQALGAPERAAAAGTATAVLAPATRAMDVLAAGLPEPLAPWGLAGWESLPRLAR